MTKKLTASLLLLTLVLSIFCSCRKDPVPVPETQPATDFEAILRRDAFPPDSALLEAMGKAVEFSKIRDTGEMIIFTLSAPDISDALLEWYESQSLVTEEALEQKMLELLEGETVSRELQLAYTRTEDGSVMFSYTEEYLTAAGCGVRNFYAYLAGKVLSGGENNG